jgi:hypothetical protein
MARLSCAARKLVDLLISHCNNSQCLIVCTHGEWKAVCMYRGYQSCGGWAHRVCGVLQCLYVRCTVPEHWRFPCLSPVPLLAQLLILFCDYSFFKVEMFGTSTFWKSVDLFGWEALSCLFWMLCYRLICFQASEWMSSALISISSQMVNADSLKLTFIYYTLNLNFTDAIGALTNTVSLLEHQNIKL